jgi:4'-phosphopantetheinyl transferase EntD
LSFVLKGFFPKGVTVSSAEIVVHKSEEASSNSLHVQSPFSQQTVSFSAVSIQTIGQFVLHPLEEEALGEAISPKRRQDFTLGRAAARRALEGVGFPIASPVLRGEHREPLWPVGVVGSISHSGGYGIAAVAWQRDIPALGVDIQQIEERYTDDLIARFADPDEFDWVRSDASRRTERAVKLFSAKESVFKALYPLGRVWFAFDVARLRPNADESTFAAEVSLPSLSHSTIHLSVGVSVHDGHVITGAWLAQPLALTEGATH